MPTHIAGPTRPKNPTTAARAAGSTPRSRVRVRPLLLSATLAAALAAALPAAHADPAVAHWTVIDLGTTGGSYSDGYAINNAGQVTGYSGNYAFLYSSGVMTALGTLPGDTFSYGYAINNAGQVAGFASTAFGGNPHAFLYSGGTMSQAGTLDSAHGINDAGQVAGSSIIVGSGRDDPVVFSNGTLQDLGTLGGTNGVAYGINNAGQVAGYAGLSNGYYHAFLVSNGSMRDLGTLGGTTSYGYALNNAGQVTGEAFISGNSAQHAFLYGNGAMTDLGTLGGTFSYGVSINQAGLVVGTSYLGGNADLHGFLYSNGAMRDLNSFNGIAGSGLTLNFARGINDVGQITGTATNGHAYIATLDTVVWESGSSGSWDATSGWSAGINPNPNTAVFIDPLHDLTVTGPADAVTIQSLNIGGDATGNNGIATLALAGSALTVTGAAGSFTTVSAKGVLAGDGSISGAVTNLGTVNATNLSLPDGLANYGTVTGNGRLNTNLANTAGGTLQLGAGQSLLLSGSAHVNDGLVQLNGGASLRVVGSFTSDSGAEVNVAGGSAARFSSSVVNAGDLSINGASSARFDADTTNAAGGRIVLDNGTARFTGGLANAGQVLVSYGGATVYGAVTTTGGGQVILSANSNSAFYGAVDVQSGAELRVSAGSTATFFGAVYQRTGSLFSGAGTSFYEGGLSVGASPGLGVNQGNVAFGSSNTYLAEIGGTTACTLACGTDDALKNSSYDKYVVAGHLALGGTLKLASWNGFVAQAGQSFDLLDWGSEGGTFTRIDASGLQLAAGTVLDTSRLYVDGTISVLAVPEPGARALMLGGLGMLPWLRRLRSVARTRH